MSQKINTETAKQTGKGTAKKTNRSAKSGQSATRSKKPVSRSTTPTKKRTGKAANYQRAKKTPELPLKIGFLGGVNEIGKNMTVYEYGDDIVIVDCGLAFPDDNMLGIDLVIPDFTYLEKNKSKIKGMVLTHGHEDHIGSLPYFLFDFNVPIYGTKLTLGLVEGKLREHHILDKCKLNVVSPGQAVGFGSITVEFINVNHSIPDAVGFAIHTPAGIVVQTGDFKIDTNPISGNMIDLGRFADLGRQGVLCLLSDSTNAERPGYTMSESMVGESFNRLFQSPAALNRRIIIATFASNIHRIQQIIDYADKYKRKVAVSGRSMINAVAISQELGYLKVPDGLLIDMTELSRFPKERIVIITTGSQGEPMSALSRMAASEHKQVEVGPDDFIIISATPIPGNEKTVGNVVNDLISHGCEVVYEKMYDVHVSGHACQEELKIMLGLIKPKFFIPVHGEIKHLKKHAMLAKSMGIDEKNILLASIGDQIELTSTKIKRADTIPAGMVMVDGLGVGDVGSIVLRDRKHLAQDGLIIIVVAVDSLTGEMVSGPDIVSRGFIYVKEAEDTMDEIRSLVKSTIDKCCIQNKDWSVIKFRVRDDLSRMLYERTKRSPMILPIVLEV